MAYPTEISQISDVRFSVTDGACGVPYDKTIIGRFLLIITLQLLDLAATSPLRTRDGALVDYCWRSTFGSQHGCSDTVAEIFLTISNEDRTMRSYPSDSPQAVSRLLALSVIIDGGGLPLEIAATYRIQSIVQAGTAPKLACTLWRCNSRARHIYQAVSTSALS